MTETNPDDALRARVFLSYSRADSDFVDRLVAALEARGYTAYLDREDISGGEAWKERLEQLILSADAVAFVISPESIASPVCEWEIERTLELGKRLVPVCLRMTDAAPMQLARLNYIFFDSDEKFDDGLMAVMHACDIDIVWVREHTRFTELAARWDSSERRVDALLRGKELVAAEGWLAARSRTAPEATETLTAFLQAARAEETVALERERRALQRMRRLQVGVGSLVALAALLVVLGGLGAARLVSGIGARNSATLAEQSRAATDQGHYDRATRYALAGLAGAEWPLLGYDADAAETNLRIAMFWPLHATLSGHETTVFSAAFSPDGTRILTASRDHTARVWDAISGRELVVLRGHDERLTSAAYSPNGSLIVTASEDGTARVWDAVSGRETALFRGHHGVQNAAFSPDGRRVVTGSLVRDAASGREIALLRADERPVMSAVFSPDGARIVTTPLDRTARVWDAASGLQSAVLFGHEERPLREGPQRSATFSPDGTFLHEGRSFLSAAFSPDGTRIVTTGHADFARVWDAVSGQQIAVLRGHEESPRSAAFSPDGSRIVTASSDGTARVWDARSGRQIIVMRGHGVGLSVAAFSPDGSRIVTASRDAYTAWVWDSTSGREVAVLRGHEGGVLSAAFNPDGTRIVTASFDGTARIWALTRSDVATRRELVDMACEGQLANGHSRFTDDELRAAPFLDPALDADPCHAPSPLWRLGVYLGFVRLTPVERVARAEELQAPAE